MTVTTMTKTKLASFMKVVIQFYEERLSWHTSSQDEDEQAGTLAVRSQDDIVFVKDMFSEREVKLNCHTQYFKL